MKQNNKKLKKIELSISEWFDALKTPAPHRNKKKYYRKNKHKGKDNC